MRHRLVPRSALLAATLALGSFASTVIATGPAAGDPRVPNDVWVQCTGFSGPSTQWPHPLTGCTSRSGEGSGQTVRTAPGTETIQWNKPFLGGKSLDLTNITSSVVGVGTGCPATHPVDVSVAGVIGPHQQFGGSPVTASICTNGNDFILKPGTLFVIHKV